MFYSEVNGGVFNHNSSFTLTHVYYLVVKRGIL
nr:MAG TPA: hypothetical protein [Caudoviricetes sp.]